MVEIDRTLSRYTSSQTMQHTMTYYRRHIISSDWQQGSYICHWHSHLSFCFTTPKWHFLSSTYIIFQLNILSAISFIAQVVSCNQLQQLSSAICTRSVSTCWTDIYFPLSKNRSEWQRRNFLDDHPAWWHTVQQLVQYLATQFVRDQSIYWRA